MVVHVKLDPGRASREARRALISLVVTAIVAALVFGSFYVFWPSGAQPAQLVDDTAPVQYANEL